MATTTPDEPVAGGAPAARTAGWRQTFAALAIPDFRLLWLGMFPSFLATAMGMVARGYLIYDMTGSATALGVVSLASGMPILAFSFYGGVTADRMSKRNLLLRTQTGAGVIALATAVLVHLGVIEVWQLVVLSLGSGTVIAFNMPARTALIPELVGADRLTNAIALNNAGQHLSRVVGPAVAGLLIGVPLVGLTGTFYIISALYLAVVFMVWRLPRGRAVEPSGTSMFSEASAGLRYVRGNGALMMLLTMAFLPTMLGMPYQNLMPVFQRDVLDTDAFGLGLLYAAIGLGSMLGALIVATLSGSRRRGDIQTVTGLLFGGGLIGFAAMHALGPALAMAALLGLASNAYISVNNAMIMAYTDPAFYGRVTSVYAITFAVQPLSVAPAGAAADAFGAPFTVAVAGALVIAIIVPLAAFVPAYRRTQ